MKSLNCVAYILADIKARCFRSTCYRGTNLAGTISWAESSQWIGTEFARHEVVRPVITGCDAV
jgi:hypothetical protein